MQRYWKMDLQSHLSEEPLTLNALLNFVHRGSSVISSFENHINKNLKTASLADLEWSLAFLARHIDLFTGYFSKGTINSTVQFNLMQYKHNYPKYNQKIMMEHFEMAEKMFHDVLTPKSLSDIDAAKVDYSHAQYVHRRLSLPFTLPVNHQRSSAVEMMIELDLLDFVKEALRNPAALEYMDPSVSLVLSWLFRLDVEEAKSVFLWHVLGFLFIEQHRIQRLYFPGMFYERADYLQVKSLIEGRLIIDEGQWKGVLIDNGNDRHPHLNGILALAEVLLKEKNYIDRGKYGKELSRSEVVRAFCLLYNLNMSERALTKSSPNHKKLKEYFNKLFPARH